MWFIIKTLCLLIMIHSVSFAASVKGNQSGITYQPESFQLYAIVGQNRSKKLTLKNTSQEIIKWQLTIDNQSNDTSNALLAENPSSITNYFFITSREEGGPSYHFQDISDSGNRVNDLKDDNYSGPYPIGFSFMFYGQAYSEFYISSNGFIGFGPPDDYKNWKNTTMPREIDPNNIIAWCWNDLKPANGAVFYQTIDQQLVVQFQNYGQYLNSGTITGQIILKANGDIVFQYKEIQDSFSIKLCSIGIENADGTYGLQIDQNKLTIQNEFAIRFSNHQNQWLSAIPTSGTLSSNSQQVINLQIDCTETPPGKYFKTMALYINNDFESPITIPVSINIISARPKLKVSPQNCVFDVTIGDINTCEMTIENTGNKDLIWQLFGFHSVLNNKSNSTLSHQLDDSILPIPIQNKPYYWKDNKDPAGPTFQWVEISKSGTPVLGLTDDFYVGPFPIGFDFPFYDNRYTEIYISSNGFIGFGPTNNYDSRNNVAIPESNSPNAILAWCWDDLKPDNGTTFYRTQNKQFIVQFNQFGQYQTTGKITAQVILKESGDIIYQYKDLTENFDTASCTIGIESANGSSGQLVIHNKTYLTPLLSIRFFARSPSKWLSVGHSSGRIKSGYSETVTIKVDSRQLNIDTYFCPLMIYTNDPNESMFEFPVKLFVQPPDILINSNPLKPAKPIISKQAKTGQESKIIALTEIPSYGNRIKDLKGFVSNIPPKQYQIVVYSFVNGWRSKPIHFNPITKINPIGTFSCDITTEPKDHEATKIAIFVIPASFSPPVLVNQKILPESLYHHAVDFVEIIRNMY